MATLKISSDLQNVIKKVVLDTYYPVGSLYLTVGSEDPNTTIGGTWVRFGNGKTLVGVDTSQTEFNSVEKTGGSKHLQKHYHDIRWGDYDGSGVTISCAGSGEDVLNIGGWNWDKNTSNSNGSGSNIYTCLTGTGDSGNLQPYITVYMWKRTK